MYCKLNSMKGPIPAAEELQRYKEISPDLPNRI